MRVKFTPSQIPSEAKSDAESESAALILVCDLARRNLGELRQRAADGTPYPAVLESGIVYGQRSAEDLATISKCLARGSADATEIVAWRLAEFWADGVSASPLLRREVLDSNPNLRYYRLRVYTPSGDDEHAGKIEDPTKILQKRTLEAMSHDPTVDGSVCPKCLRSMCRHFRRLVACHFEAAVECAEAANRWAL